jgi:hypothetical protein
MNGQRRYKYLVLGKDKSYFVKKKQKNSNSTKKFFKGSGWLLFVVLEKPLYEVCLIRIKEHVGEKRSTVCAHMHADCLLKETSKITNMLSRNFTTKKMISIFPF